MFLGTHDMTEFGFLIAVCYLCELLIHVAQEPHCLAARPNMKLKKFQLSLIGELWRVIDPDKIVKQELPAARET